MESQGGDDECDPGNLGERGYLPQDENTDGGCGCRQEREEEREARSLQPRHGELVADIGITEDEMPTPIAAARRIIKEEPDRLGESVVPKVLRYAATKRHGSACDSWRLIPG